MGLANVSSEWMDMLGQAMKRIDTQLSQLMLAAETGQALGENVKLLEHEVLDSVETSTRTEHKYNEVCTMMDSQASELASCKQRVNDILEMERSEREACKLHLQKEIKSCGEGLESWCETFVRRSLGDLLTELKRKPDDGTPELVHDLRRRLQQLEADNPRLWSALQENSQRLQNEIQERSADHATWLRTINANLQVEQSKRSACIANLRRAKGDVLAEVATNIPEGSNDFTTMQRDNLSRGVSTVGELALQNELVMKAGTADFRSPNGLSENTVKPLDNKVQQVTSMENPISAWIQNANESLDAERNACLRRLQN